MSLEWTVVCPFKKAQAALVTIAVFLRPIFDGTAVDRVDNFVRIALLYTG